MPPDRHHKQAPKIVQMLPSRASDVSPREPERPRPLLPRRSQAIDQPRTLDLPSMLPLPMLRLSLHPSILAMRPLRCLGRMAPRRSTSTSALMTAQTPMRRLVRATSQTGSSLPWAQAARRRGDAPLLPVTPAGPPRVDRGGPADSSGFSDARVLSVEPQPASSGRPMLLTSSIRMYWFHPQDSTPGRFCQPTRGRLSRSIERRYTA